MLKKKKKKIIKKREEGSAVTRTRVQDASSNIKNYPSSLLSPIS